MQNHKIVSGEEWLVARTEHLANEKGFTRPRDQLSQDRRNLPWVMVEKEHQFDGPITHRDISLAVVSRAKPDTLESYKKRMGWSVKSSNCMFIKCIIQT